VRALPQIAIDLSTAALHFTSPEIVETKASVATNPCSSIFFQPGDRRSVARFRSPLHIEEFRERLRDLGYVEAGNIITDARTGCVIALRECRYQAFVERLLWFRIELNATVKTRAICWIEKA